ncbi:Putative odorant receptor 13a, partial [Eufriesea mexicana]
MSIAVTADVIHNIDDLDEATECALICTAFYLCIVRLVVYSYHQKDMLYVMNTMKEDWISSSDEDRIILAEKTMFAFRLAKYFISTVAVTIVLFMCVPILEIYVIGANEKVLPFRGYFFINQSVSPVFECLYLFNVTAGGFGGSMIAGATSFNLVVIMHGSAKFAVLRKRLEALSSEDPNSTAIMGSYMMEDKGRLMKYSTFLNSAILELFMFSFSGNGLIDESEAVGISAYGSGWIGSHFCQSLQIMMMRSRIPSKITAAKFYSMSLESFSAVLSTSFSYFTVLSATKD